MDGIRLDFRYDRWCGWLLGLFGMGRRFSSVILHDDAIVVKMGWAFRAEIPRANVTTARPYDGLVWGWGVHGWRGRWLVNGSSKGLVTLDIDPAVPARMCGLPIKLRQVILSLEEPEVLLV